MKRRKTSNLIYGVDDPVPLVSPSGYGVHWPLLDEDIAIDGLLGIVHTREIQRKSV
jgi:hypothetical protein